MTTELNELQRKWLEALRSGNYTQCYSVLRGAVGGYCCLGVLCDVYDSAGWVGTLWRVDEDGQETIHGLEPPRFLAEEVGLDNGDVGACVDLNDAVHAPFTTIADKLEAYWLEGTPLK